MSISRKLSPGSQLDSRRSAADVTAASVEPRLDFVSRLAREHLEHLCRIFQSESCSRGRRLEDVRRMVEHSDLIFGYCDPETGRLVAFARVLTDFVYKAVVFDVIVDRRYRRTGTGRVLLDAITSHPALLFVEHIELACRDEMAAFYRKWGFSGELRKLRLMRRVQQPLLLRPSLTRKAS